MEGMFTQNTDGKKMIEITLAAIIGILGGVAGTLFAINQDLSLIHISEPTRPY